MKSMIQKYQLKSSVIIFFDEYHFPKDDPCFFVDNTAHSVISFQF